MAMSKEELENLIDEYEAISRVLNRVIKSEEIKKHKKLYESYVLLKRRSDEEYRIACDKLRVANLKAVDISSMDKSVIKILRMRDPKPFLEIQREVLGKTDKGQGQNGSGEQGNDSNQPGE